MSVVFPFFILSIFSYSISCLYKIALARSYLISSISIVLLLIFFGKFGLLYLTNEILKYLAVILLIYLIFKKKINTEYLKSFFLFLTIYLLLTFLCKDLFFYKYDEFSEYGITSKLIFTENDLPSNIDYLQKGSHHKINFISYFHYFFLKHSSQIFQENIAYVAHSFLIIILIFTSISFVNLNYVKKILVGILFYFLIYTLGPGLDRLYVDSILGLFVAITLLLFFKKEKNKFDFFLLFILVLTIPMIKPNGIIIIFGLLVLFFCSDISKKNFTNILPILFAILVNFYFTKFYVNDLSYFNFDKIKVKNFDKIKVKERQKVNLIHPTQSFTLTTLQQLNYIPTKIISKNKSKLISNQLNNLYNNGIYHSKTFLILNKIFSKTKINFKIIEIPINLFIWLMIILLIAYFISKKQNNQKFYLISFLYFGFILTYFIFLIIWALKNHLINEDFSLAVSWERHLGTIILGYIVFLLINLFKYFKNYYLLIGICFLFINISPANSIRIFLPLEIIIKEKFWSSKYSQRLEINKLSNKIKNEIKDYSFLILEIDKNQDPYFIEILKYELIKINTIIIDYKADYNTQVYINNFNFDENKLHILSNKINSADKIESRIEKINETKITLDKKNLITLNKKNLFDEFVFYEISQNMDQENK